MIYTQGGVVQRVAIQYTTIANHAVFTLPTMDYAAIEYVLIMRGKLPPNRHYVATCPTDAPARTGYTFTCTVVASGHRTHLFKITSHGPSGGWTYHQLS